MSDKIQRSEAEWREQLGAERYRILREAGTEAAFTGALLADKGDGAYVCGACGEPLFDAASKYDSGSGWPSFTAPADPEAVAEITDRSHGITRTEVRCAKCQGHLGHVFPDGPGPGGLRYCINSASLDFAPAELAARPNESPTPRDEST